MDIETISCDYVVVGSGSAGGVVAARLSENGANQVLLLEAGPAQGAWTSVPMGFAKVLANPDLMWNYDSEPEPELNGRRISAIRGKILGGSSSVNGLVYVRGAPGDYAIWRQMGATGWSYEDVLPFFRKAERQERGPDEYHGGEGPLGVESGRWPNPLADAFIEAAQTIGIPPSSDLCRRDIEGVGYYQLTTWKGRRSSTAECYLKPALRRANLDLRANALVLKIECEGREARSVLFEQGGKTYRVVPRRETIISAGSFHSPKLLQLSGIGPAGHLREHGIPVVHDLPGVGENLMDHLLPKLGFTVSSQYTFNAVMSSFVSQAKAGLRYVLAKSGPLSVGAALAGGYTYTQSGLEEPDIQMFFIPFEAGDYSGNLPKRSSFQVTMYQNRPESRGTVRIRSADPREGPAISPRYLTSEADIRCNLAGLRIVRRIGQAAPLRAFGSREMEMSAGRESDEALLGYVRETASSAYHHVGTCRIGDDAAAVVDPTLKVHGIGRLRVIDGSVMPTVVSANTNAACIMIGEKGASHVLAAR